MIKRLLMVIPFFISMVCAQPLFRAQDLGAKAFILLDVDSQRVLVHYRATERLNPASITKLMTAYVVYKTLKSGSLSLQDTTVISKNARDMEEGSRMFLEQGTRVSIEDLLHGLVIQSGNDAAVALAEAVSGTEAQFVNDMNKHAKILGMNNSHFKNVTGLTEKGHYMSAHDIATLANAIITEFPKHYEIYKEKSFEWNGIKQNNRNALLRTDASVDGLKTGYTEAAGYCLATSAKRNGMRVISVVMGTKSTEARADASRKILAYGFDNFAEHTLLKMGQKIALSPVKNGKDENVSIVAKKGIRLPISQEEKKFLQAQLVLQRGLEAPIRKGQYVGNIVIKKNGAILASVPAMAQSKVEELGFWGKLKNKLFD